jgi:DNA-binding SARP family transcriptional activator
MARLGLTLLGGFQAQLDTGQALGLPTKKAQALLAYLAIPLGRAHPRDKLAALLWGGIREESARASLRQALFAIRKALGEAKPSPLTLEGETLALNRSGVDVDVATFEGWVAEGTPEALEKATTLYQGDLLAGFAVDQPPFEEWLVTERERLHELASEGLAKLLAHQRKARAGEAAVQTALKLLSLDPLQEPVHRTLMRLYAEMGRRGAALRQYQHCVGVLQRELGVEPEPETKELFQEILRQRPSRPETVPTRAPARAGEPSPRRVVSALEAPLIGRAAEMERLASLLKEVWDGNGRLAAVIGEAGIGKTRVVAELATRAEQEGGRVLLGRSYESEQALPFGPWVDAFRADDVIQELGGIAPVWRSELARLIPELAGPRGQSPAGAADYRQIFGAVAQAIRHLARLRPTLLVLEDVHWADEMSLRLLPFLGRRIEPWPVLVVFTAREEELADARALRHAIDELSREQLLVQLPLGPLSQADTFTLVRALARAGSKEAAVARLGEQAWATSEGNPFVAVETVRARAEGAALAPGTALALPQRVREIVTRRFERLSERARSLVAVAAVIGREFDFPLLQRAADLGEAEAAEGAEELVRRRLLHGVGERFDFTHDRIREVAYAGLLAPRCRFLHRRVAEAIEVVYAGNLEPHALALGRHYRESEAWERAAACLRQAGTAAAERSALRETVVCFEQAAEALARLPASRETIEQAIDVRFQLHGSLAVLGESRRSLAYLREAEAFAEKLQDRGRLGRVFANMTYALGALGDLDGAIDVGERARAIAAALDDRSLRVGTNVTLGRAYYGRGHYAGSIECSRENIALLSGDLIYKRSGGPILLASVASHIGLVLCLAELGEFAAGAAHGQEAIRIAETVAYPDDRAWAYFGVGRLCAVKGEFAQSIALLEQALPLIAEGEVPIYFPRVASSLGLAYMHTGRLGDALEILERAMVHGEGLGFMFGHALVEACLAEALLHAGRVEAASRLADRALERARRQGEHGWAAWTLRLHGEIASADDRPTDAEGFYRRAIALTEERGMRPLLAHCRLGLGQLYRRTGRREEAGVDLCAGLEMYRALDMGFWAARAEAELASVR